MTQRETWRVNDNMGTQISSDGYGSIGPNKADGDWQT